MAANEILSHPALDRSVRVQAQTLLSLHEASPRTASPFASQQRCLMGHLAAYFRHEAQQAGSGVLTERLVDLIGGHELASRNIAAAFVNEMLKPWRRMWSGSGTELFRCSRGSTTA